jgi:hypothetical protein
MKKGLIYFAVGTVLIVVGWISFANPNFSCSSKSTVSASAAKRAVVLANAPNTNPAGTPVSVQTSNSNVQNNAQQPPAPQGQAAAPVTQQPVEQPVTVEAVVLKETILGKTVEIDDKGFSVELAPAGVPYAKAYIFEFSANTNMQMSVKKIAGELFEGTNSAVKELNIGPEGIVPTRNPGDSNNLGKNNKTVTIHMNKGQVETFLANKKAGRIDKAEFTYWWVLDRKLLNELRQEAQTK